jgi:hypothetical protein
LFIVRQRSGDVYRDKMAYTGFYLCDQAKRGIKIEWRNKPVQTEGSVTSGHASFYDSLNEYFNRRWDLADADRDIVSVAGEWIYHMKDASGVQNWGRCTITQTGREIDMDGHRSWQFVAGQESEDDIGWNTTWGWICDDESIRVDYMLHVGTAVKLHVPAFCKVKWKEVKKKEAVRLSGTYALITNSERLNSKTGDIVFVRGSADILKTSRPDLFQEHSQPDIVGVEPLIRA